MYSGLANFFFLGFVPLSGTQKVAFFFSRFLTCLFKSSRRMVPFQGFD